jgi:hypothetical protein
MVMAAWSGRRGIGTTAWCLAVATAPCAAADAGPGRAGAQGAAEARAAAADAGPTAPAIAGGQRAMGADAAARAHRAVEAMPSTTIWQSRLADGTLELSDRPPSQGAADVARLSYPQPRDAGASRQRADAERDYWRRQAEGFEQRRRERDRQAERARREPPRPPMGADWDGGPYRWVHPGYGWLPASATAGVPGALWDGVSPTYGTSPGAVQGRAAGGFIGSGFSTAR